MLSLKLSSTLEKERQIIFYKQYFQDFYLSLDENVQEKIGYVFRLIKTVNQVSEKFLKHVEGTDGLYEIRIEVGSNIYRIFCCFDKSNLVVLFNGFQKKTQKTPNREIERARQIKLEYLNQK